MLTNNELMTFMKFLTSNEFHVRVISHGHEMKWNFFTLYSRIFATILFNKENPFFFYFYFLKQCVLCACVCVWLMKFGVFF